MSVGGDRMRMSLCASKNTSPNETMSKSMAIWSRVSTSMSMSGGMSLTVSSNEE